MMNIAFFIILQTALFAVPVLILYCLWRLLRAYERRGSTSTEVTALNERVSQLEERLADLGAEHATLSEEQRFLTRLLSERHADRVTGDA